MRPDVTAAGEMVDQVVARARVSRNAFYELWRDKTDCFIALCDELTLAHGDLIPAALRTSKELISA